MTSAMQEYFENRNSTHTHGTNPTTASAATQSTAATTASAATQSCMLASTPTHCKLSEHKHHRAVSCAPVCVEY